MELEADDVQLFKETTQQASRVVRALSATSNVGTSQSHISINAGGIGVWVAVTCCLVMLGMVIVGAFWISSEFDRINSRFNDQTDTDSVQDAYIHKLRAEQKQEKR